MSGALKRGFDPISDDIPPPPKNILNIVTPIIMHYQKAIYYIVYCAHGCVKPFERRRVSDRLSQDIYRNQIGRREHSQIRKNFISIDSKFIVERLVHHLTDMVLCVHCLFVLMLYVPVKCVHWNYSVLPSEKGPFS